LSFIFVNLTAKDSLPDWLLLSRTPVRSSN
jgi:hypothetical protein